MKIQAQDQRGVPWQVGLSQETHKGGDLVRGNPSPQDPPNQEDDVISIVIGPNYSCFVINQVITSNRVTHAWQP